MYSSINEAIWRVVRGLSISWSTSCSFPLPAFGSEPTLKSQTKLMSKLNEMLTIVLASKTEAKDKKTKHVRTERYNCTLLYRIKLKENTKKVLAFSNLSHFCMFMFYKLETLHHGKFGRVDFHNFLHACDAFTASNISTFPFLYNQHLR